MLRTMFLAALVVATPCQAWNLDKYPPIPDNIDISIPKENCIKAAEVVINQDVELFKALFIPNPATDAQVAQLLKTKHDKYFKKRYTGISNFRLSNAYDYYYEDAKNSINDVVSSEAKSKGYDEEVWIGYTFDTTDPETNFDGEGGGYCRFAKVDEHWYMINLL
ncbi:hypothetical protein TUM4438_18160 [Shewanella sairae]|uniref:DUF4019 domain-containing protein n=1 Tax=Shewanella sairae TaxID=190310 RepID=A0ABQ4PCB2_9GAMM|nr:hypothetical protein [Shewanella sairae]MCL1130937.1 hypothetical protein [Shewanella sairae]GIU45207.1 hypothetical protein TUM4438_18160 [Shewanella sairae]